MKVLKGHKFRVDFSESQEALACKTAGVCRAIYNIALQQRTTAYHSVSRHRIYYEGQASEISELKEAFPWIGEVPYHCIQQSLKNLQTAFKNFFEGHADYPTMKKKFYEDSFKFPDPKQFQVDEENQRIRLPKFGWISYRNGKGKHALKLAGEIKSITISRCADQWFASVLCEMEVSNPKPVTGIPIGIDLGVVKTIATSQRETLEIVGMSKEDWKKKAKLQRNLARKKKGSRNRKKVGRKLARFDAKIARRRRDSIHKATTYLAKNHSLIVMEDLKVKNMTKSAKGTKKKPGNNVKAKSGLNRSIMNVGFGEIRRQLEYKCQWYGSELRKVTPNFTSQECPKCHHIAKENRISQSVFCCVKCNHTENADYNATENILAAGQAVSACGGNAVRSRRSRKTAA